MCRDRAAPPRRCAFVGCDSPTGTCTRVEACDSFGTGNPPRPGPLTLCDCRNQTVTVDWICGVEQPYRHVGPCG
jgi:hypothetical protein